MEHIMESIGFMLSKDFKKRVKAEKVGAVVGDAVKRIFEEMQEEKGGETK